MWEKNTVRNNVRFEKENFKRISTLKKKSEVKKEIWLKMISCLNWERGVSERRWWPIVPWTSVDPVYTRPKLVHLAPIRAWSPEGPYSWAPPHILLRRRRLPRSPRHKPGTPQRVLRESWEAAGLIGSFGGSSYSSLMSRIWTPKSMNPVVLRI